MAVKCIKCKAELRDEDKFCVRCGTPVSDAIVILCSGITKTGVLCGAELLEGSNFCRKCGKKVDQMLFQKKQRKCQGVMEDGSFCNCILEDDDEFCMKCGKLQDAIPVASEEMERSRTHQNVNIDNNSTVEVVNYAQGSVFGSHAKLDGENAHEENKGQTSVSRFPATSPTLFPENVIVTGLNNPLDGEGRKEEISHDQFPQSSSMSGKLSIFRKETHFDGKTVGHSSSSGSPDSVTVHENDLDNDSEDGKTHLTSSGESASKNNSDIASKFSHVTLLEQMSNDLELALGDGMDDDSQKFEGGDRFSEDSSLDSTDTESVEDEVTDIIIPPEQKKIKPKRKKGMKYKVKLEKKIKMEIVNKGSHEESSGQFQEPQQNDEIEIDRNINNNQPAEGQKLDSQHMQENIVTGNPSVIAVGSTVDSTNQMGKDEGQTPVQSVQDDKSINASGAEERNTGMTDGSQSNNKNAIGTNISVEETRYHQEPRAEVFDEGKRGTTLWSSVVKIGASHTDRKETAKNMQTAENKEYSAGPDSQCDEKKIKKASNDTSGERPKGSNIKMEIVVHKEPDRGKMDNKHKDSQKESGETPSISAQNNKGGGKGAGKNTTERKKSDSLKVYFHALLSPEFDLSNADQVVIKFGDERLGKWESNEHKLTVVSHTENGYVELKLLVNMPKDILLRTDKRLQYKYVVIKDWDKDPIFIWEKYEYQHRDANRIILVKDKMKIKDEWHQYDGVVYPKPEEKFLQKVRNKFKEVKDFFTGGTADRHTKDLNRSLFYFQPELFHALLKGQEPSMSVDEAIMHLEQLVNCLNKVYFIDRYCYNKIEEYRRQVTDSILVPVLQTFSDVSIQDWKESVKDAEIRMIRAITVLSAVGYLGLELKHEEQNLLARGLLVRPNHVDKKCYDMSCIDKFVPNEKKKLLLSFLIGFIEGIARTAKESSIFLCMPLYHFLAGLVQPFEKVSNDISHDSKVPKWWGVSSLTKAVDDFKKVVPSKWTMPLEKVVTALHPLFELDFLLPRTIMAMLNLEEVVLAIKSGQIPLEVCAACLACFVKSTRPRYQLKVLTDPEKKVADAIDAFLKACKMIQLPEECTDSVIVQAKLLYRISSDLVNETLGTISTDMVTCAAQAFLHTIALYDLVQKKEDNRNTSNQEGLEHVKTLNQRYQGVIQWLNVYYYKWDIYLEDHLKVWDCIVAPQNLPSETVRDAWNSQTEEELFRILERVFCQSSYSTTSLIELYCTKVDSFQPCVQNCLSRLAFRVIARGYDLPAYRFGERERARFGKLLSDLFEREWRTAFDKKDMEEDRIILHHILTWTPFSHFLNMFYGDERKLLSDTCLQGLVQAVSLIEDRLRALEHGTITLRDLDEIKTAEEKFQEVAVMVCQKANKKNDKIMNVARTIKIRQREVDGYNTQKEHIFTLLQLCQYIPTIQLAEIDRTVKYLEEKKDLSIRDICKPANLEEIPVPERYQPKIIAFNLSSVVVSMLEPMHASYRGNIFLNLWQVMGRATKATTLEDVCEQVFKPVYSKMKEITQKLVTGEIQFAEMENYLGKIYKDEYVKMVEEMILINVPEVKALERVQQLDQFRLMEECVVGAKTILDVAIAYRLKGDFHVIKTIASQENAANKMMKNFDASLLKTCKFLRDLTPDKTKCLNQFIKCSPLIHWLRESMKGGLKELKVFVDLASISAGEGDMEIAKVNCLHAATTGYAPLIFDLDENSGYEALLDKCQILWKELKADQNLPAKLLDTNRHLEWLKTVKQAHGSVEVTSLAQAEAINSKGIFCVGALPTAKDTKMGLYLQNTLQLTVPDHEKEFHGHRQYTFEQLQDLQSRLMLVAGKAEQGKDDVDRFMLVFDSVMRLANVFIKLHSAGCVLFKHWQSKFLCDISRPVCAFIEFGQGAKPLKGKRNRKDDVTTVIPKMAKFMENCLDKWIDHINQKRLDFLELNYFTTDQLVILQQELVKVGPDQTPDIRIYPLLSAVKENCTYEDLVDAMRKASKDVEVSQMEVDEELEMEGKEDEVASDKQKEEEEVQNFIREMIDAGFSEKLAKAALKDLKPDQVTDGIIWCNDHLEEEDTHLEEEEDTDMWDRDPPAQEAVPYEGWKKSDQTVMAITAGILNRLEGAKGDMDVDPLIKDMEILWKEFLTSVSSSLTDYLSVEHLGLILRRLAEKDPRQIKRPFPPSFVQGTPNLIICPKADVLSTVLSIYMMDMNQPLPQADEILMCTPQTTLDQLDVFWRRTLADRSNKIHCLVNSDLLDFEVSDRGERRLDQYMQQRKELDLEYKLVVVCSAENEYKSRIITALDRFRRPPLPIPDIQHIANYVGRKLQVKEGNSAAAVDFDSSSVRVVKSWRAGVGKSLYVKRRNQELIQNFYRYKITDLVNIPLQDKEINVSQVTQILLTHILPHGVTTPRIFHLDIAHEVQEGVDFFLFNLLILGCLTDKFGYVWRRLPRDLYLIETMPIVELSQARKGGSASYVHHVFDFLPFLTCRSPQESLDILTNKPKPRDFKQEDPQFDLKEFTGAIFQRPYQYLSRLDQGRGIDDVNPAVPWGTPADCLRVLLKHCGVPDPSWAELHHFVWFFNTQLRDFEKSSFCSEAVAEDLPGFSRFVLRFLIQMSRDFSTRSLEMSEESPTTRMDIDQEDEGENEGRDEEGEEGLAQYKMRRTWESSPHPYLFFNPDGHTITFLGFNIDRNTGNLIDQQTRKVLETAIMPQNLYDSLVRNQVPIQEDFDSLPRDKKIERLCRVMGNDLPHDPDDTYELTTDNVKKILAIYMRFRCDIPVIIMGETGCGKTRLVKFLCALQTPPGADVKNMILMKVHGGTTNSDIKRKVEEARKIAQENIDTHGPHIYTVLFFDEANTTEAIGMIKEIMCDKSMDGNKLYRCQNLKFVAACNPYRMHSETLIKRLEQAGLGYHVDADKTRDRLGRIPMRRLVYRVQPLPQSLLPLVWDFGQLNTQIEDLYIRQMVKRYIRDNKLPKLLGLIEVISGVLTASQDFMRQQEGECSFVSLRDVERVLNVMSWFYAQSLDQRTLFNEMDQIIQPLADQEPNTDEEEAEDGEEAEDMPEVNEPPNQGLHDITRSLVLALGVCYHACLKNREEYRMHVAPFFRAPCHLTGGHGQIEREISVCQNVFLENVQLENNIARNTALKENVFMMVTSIELRIPLFLVGKPGSSKSLAKTIVADAMQGNAAHMDLFRELKQVQMVSFQCSPLSTPDGIVGTFRQCAQFQKDKDLDRFVSVVVLDEVGLAEDSPRMPLKTLHPLLEDGCQGDEKPELHKKVAFVGISNWALDPAKMNRGILVQREVPDLEELKNTAEGIWSAKGHVSKYVEPFIEPLAKSYLDLFKVASDKLREFFGLRDFYSLMKMIYSFVEQTKKPPTWHQLLHSIKRNFGGLDTISPVQTFAKRLTMVDKETEPRVGDPDCTTAGLITACLYNTNKQSESRYLLLLTENYGALTILQQLIPAGNNIITIFGSSFPSDQEYTQVCRNINRIKVCMETGNTVVLLNLENLYESLYDALNQYYVYFGGERYVDLGLGTHRVKCRVHKNFRLIVVAEKDVVYKKFPIPLINRLEKHFLTVNTILTRDQLDLAEELEKWAKDFSTEVAKHLHEKSNPVRSVGEVFMGYHADTCSSIILHVWQRLREQNPPKDQIMDEAKRLLLWCATPDAVVRLESCRLVLKERKVITHIYMNEQCHDNLAQYLHFKLMMEKTEELFAQITTHSKLLSTADKSDIHRAVGIPPERIALETLQSFDTEQQFSRKIRSFFESNPDEESILVVQCDSGDTNANLVACARYCTLDEHQQMKERRTAPCHVVLIIQLPRIAGGCYTGFQCRLWHSVHLDDLRAQDEEMPSIMEMLGKSVGTLMERAVGTQSTHAADMDEEEDFEANRVGQSAVAMETDEMESEQNDTEIPRQVKTEQMEWVGEEAEKPLSEPDQGQGHELQDVINERIDHKLNVRNLILSCIQPALAMVKDKEETSGRSTRRIELMLDLLHQNPIDGFPSFLQGLSCHIAALLKEKEKKYSYKADNWLSSEAAKPENINKAGTFRRACIQYLESKIYPILAGIIAHIDTNHNLDIIHNHITSGDWKARLWLQILNTPGAIQLQYSDLQSPTRQQELNEVVVKTTGCEGQMFAAVMPFSWLIYEQIDNIWRTDQESQKEDEINIKMEKIVGLVKETKLGQQLEALEGSVSSEDVGYLYAQDFTYMVYHAQSPVEYELVHNAIMQTSAVLLEDNTPNILARLVWIHESHSKIVQHLRYFRSINQVWPECAAAIRSMQVENPGHFLLVSDQFTLAILGLCMLIEQLKPPDNNYLNNAASRQEWLRKICNYRPVIEKGLDLYSLASGTRVDEAVLQGKQMWTRITVVKLFIEHVVTSEKEAEKHGPKHIMPLWVMLGDTTDLKQVHSIENVEKFLKMCNRTAIKDLLGEEQKCCHCEDKIEGTPIVLPCKDAICIRCFREIEALGTKKCPKCSRNIPDRFNPEATGRERKGVQKFKDYQSRCNSFFMDIVSQLCFVDNTAPSDQVVDKLLGYITMTTTPGKRGTIETRHLTKELTIFNDCVDPNPVFRSFLLQLLLRTSEERVHFILEKYFHNAQAVIGKDNIDIEVHMVQLCQLVVQCLEDSFYRDCLKDNEVAIATNYLTDAVDDIRTSPNMLDRLYGIAKARFGLAIVAKHIQETVLKKGQMVAHEQRRLIERAETLCEDACKWPKIFFIKYLCRCYGVDSYQAVCQKTDVRYLRWIKYQPAEEKDRVREVSDRYIVCGPHYINIREAVTKVVLGEDAEQLDKAIKDTKMPENRMEILLCLALQREITMSKLQEEHKSKVTPKAIEMLQKFCLEAKFMKNKDIAQKILQNKYGVQSPFLNVMPGLDLKQQGVLCLLMHCDLVLRNLHGDSTLIQPLVKLSTQPQTMRAAFLPTMPQDDVEEIRAVLLAHRQGDNPVFYRCPNGHPYVIGDCGRPATVGVCKACGAVIGGQGYQLRPGNVQDQGGVDRTETGHILGRAENRTQIGPERSLSPAYCGIIRLLTHITMMLGANINSLAVSEFIKPNINNGTVPQFLWQHIEHDLDDLHRALGKSLDDIFIILHSILSGMMEGHNENERLVDDLCGLMTKGGRNEWEKRFSERYVAPVLQNMENILKECNQQLAQDKRLGSDPLLCLLYEIAQPQKDIPLEMLQEIPSMWRFRSHITMDHLRHEFEVQMMAKKKYQGQHKVLQLFLKEEHHLRAIRYLPSILKLQRILFQKYQRKLDRAEASTITVETLRKESEEDELPRLLDEYAEAWDLVRENLVHVLKEYRRRRIDDSTPVSQLLPTASDAGHCAYSVLEFLFRTQNEFMDNYYREVKKRVAEIPHVKVRDITPAHLISYHPEQDILPLVLANCNYSFEVGKGTTIEYNFTNLERQIMDRFLFGKSWIDIEIHLMVYRAEYTNATVFRKLQEKIPQEPLSTGLKRKISEEFRSLPDLCQALDNLDIAISFLKSIGGNPENNLDTFMVETLKMEQSLYSPKARQICQYQHAQSLWLLLSLEKNKQLALHNQMIFDGLPEQFHQQLSAELLEQVMAFLQPLSLEKLGLLLELMFECIVLDISVPQNPDDEDYVDAKEIKFKDYLSALMIEKDTEIPIGLDTFPDDVLSKFCVATWTFTYQYLQEKKRQRY